MFSLCRCRRPRTPRLGSLLRRGYGPDPLEGELGLDLLGQALVDGGELFEQVVGVPSPDTEELLPQFAFGVAGDPAPADKQSVIGDEPKRSINGGVEVPNDFRATIAMKGPIVEAAAITKTFLQVGYRRAAKHAPKKKALVAVPQHPGDRLDRNRPLHRSRPGLARPEHHHSEQHRTAARDLEHLVLQP